MQQTVLPAHRTAQQPSNFTARCALARLTHTSSQEFLFPRSFYSQDGPIAEHLHVVDAPGFNGTNFWEMYEDELHGPLLFDGEWYKVIWAAYDLADTSA
jgi:hypothetical protein